MIVHMTQSFPGGPQYALVAPGGKLLAYLVPAQGVDLKKAVNQSMVSSDLILASISDSVRESRLSTPEEVRQALANAETFAMLKARMAIAPQVDVTTIVALNGDVINFSRSFPPPPINLSDRDYFKALLADDKLDVFLSVPVRNRGTGTWTFYLARKVRAPDGRMLGVLLTGLHSSYFSDYFERVSLAGSAVSLFRQDGMLMARYPEREDLIGTSFANQPAFKDVILKGDDVDLTKLPFYPHHAYDGSCYMSSATDYVIDPATGRRNVEYFMGKEMAEWIFKQENTDMPLPIVTGPDKFIVVCVGGKGMNQNAIFTCGHGTLVTREVKLPKNWKALVEKYRNREIERLRRLLCALAEEAQNDAEQAV